MQTPSKSFARAIPRLSHDLHKGQCGRIGVVGGSEEYSGAPFFAAIAAFRAGADLVHVFCHPEASQVIKTYSPDLIVHPYLSGIPANLDEDVERIVALFPRLHCLVVGPGLSRDPEMLTVAKEVIVRAVEHEKLLVIDADGLFLISQHPEIIQGYSKAILTPNKVEFARLCQTMSIRPDPPTATFGSPAKDPKLTSLSTTESLARAFGNVTIVQKGPQDIIANGVDTPLISDTPGSNRRCGGQGDLLSGTIATFFAWTHAEKANLFVRPPPNEADGIQWNPTIVASWAASRLIRQCSLKGFSQRGRSLVTADLIDLIGPTFHELYET